MFLTSWMQFLISWWRPRYDQDSYYPDGTQRTYEGPRWHDDDAPHDRRGFGGIAQWIEWHGGECPLPAGTWFEYRLRSGGTGAALNNPTAWDWRHHSCAGVGPAMTVEAAQARGEYDIVAYRMPLSELPSVRE